MPLTELDVLNYHEPSAIALLTLTSFIYLLQVFRDLADKICSAGLLGEIALGIIFGKPLADILDRAWEETFMDLGYLGLVLIVFEGVCTEEAVVDFTQKEM
jgi:hypothetical protein